MRYQRIESHIWHDEKFIKLTHIQQLLFFYILSSPHNNLVGIYVLKQGYIHEDIKVKSTKRDMDRLVSFGLVQYDYETGLIYIPNFLKHNILTNPNQFKSARKILSKLPKSYLLSIFWEGLSEGLKKGLGKDLSEVLTKPETEAEEETETNTETEVILYGQFKNVKLSSVEMQKLRDKLNSEAGDYIERLSEYMASKGKTYKDHYATILGFYRRDSEKKKDCSKEEPVKRFKSNVPEILISDDKRQTKEEFKKGLETLKKSLD